MRFANFLRAWRPPRQVRTRLMLGVTLSLLFHGLLLSLQFGIPGLGMPGLELPWSERRAQTPELSVRLMNVPGTPPSSAQIAPEPSAPASAAPEAAEPPRAELPPSGPQLKMIAPHKTPSPAPPVEKPKSAAIAKKPKRVKPTPPAPLPKEPSQEPAPPQVIARDEPNEDAFVVPAPSPEEPEPKSAPRLETPAPVKEIAEQAEPETAPAIPLEDPAAKAREQAIAEQESARQAEELLAKRQEETNAQRQMQELETRKQAEEAARTAAALERQKQEQAKAERQALELEARKQAEEAARLQAAAQARQKLAEELAAKEKAKQAEEMAAKEKARQAEELAAKERAQELAERQQADAKAAQERERDRIAAANQAAANQAAANAAAAAGNNKQGETPGLAKSPAGGDLIGKALGQARKLDLPRIETPVRDPLPGDPDNARRRSIFGSLDKDVGLAMYIDAWRLKIERNGRLNYSQSSSEKARGDPVVTVAIRSDGSVDEIIINRSSGRPELDEAVRRIVRLNARYSSFPPALARSYDVIEIRRIWSFDDTLRIIEEVR